MRKVSKRLENVLTALNNLLEFFYVSLNTYVVKEKQKYSGSCGILGKTAGIASF